MQAERRTHLTDITAATVSTSSIKCSHHHCYNNNYYYYYYYYY
jgi:hypothetical protein